MSLIGKIGHFSLFSINTGDFSLDGGAMFGVVPKTLWSKKIPADENNRIRMTMRCMLIKSEKTGRNYLIDTGLGYKYDEKFKKIYDVDDEGKDLITSLKNIGLSADDITDVIFTHLHFDHGGGAVAKNDSGELVMQFQNATHWITPEHWKAATEPNAREKASFLPENMNPLKTNPLLKFSDAGHVFEPGLDTIIMNGHTLGQQLPRVSDGTKTVVYAADLIPSAAHIPLAWVMGYDMFPLQTLTEKEVFLKQAVDENWTLFLEHDLDVMLIKVEYNGKHFSAKQVAEI
jgi:glyoxylase-like metal-dependent hydrolase (beta-lactamase superfamily II)